MNGWVNGGRVRLPGLTAIEIQCLGTWYHRLLSCTQVLLATQPSPGADSTGAMLLSLTV
jgi:hypothetical protein